MELNATDVADACINVVAQNFSLLREPDWNWLSYEYFLKMLQAEFFQGFGFSFRFWFSNNLLFVFVKLNRKLLFWNSSTITSKVTKNSQTAKKELFRKRQDFDLCL